MKAGSRLAGQGMRSAVLVVATGVFGCSGSGPSPTSPSAATPTPATVSPTPLGPTLHFTVVDGVSGTAVGAGQVAVAGSAGVAFSSGFDAAVGVSAIISAPGYLRRETTLAKDTRIVAWPAADTTEEEYTRRLVYVNAVDNLTERTLFRLPVGVYEVSLSAELDTSATRGVLERVFTRLREATNGAVSLTLGSANPLVRVSVDPTVTPFAAFTNWDSQGGYIGSGTVRLVSVARAQDEALLLHEFGHMLGLQHSNRSEDVMNPSARSNELTFRERSTITMMFQRTAGNHFPDADSGFAFRSVRADAQFSCGR